MRVMGAVLMLAALLQGGGRVAPERDHFQYLRTVQVEPGSAAAACAVLDSTVYAHAKPALTDVRLFSGEGEVPYALTLSETTLTADGAKILNRGVQGRHLVFDLEMPNRAYTHVKLDLLAEDFVANVRVTGLRSLGEANGTYLGTFTLFDLSSQSLARNVTLPLAESTFPYLHVDVDVVSSTDGSKGAELLDPTMIRGAEVPPSREAQTVYTTVAETQSIEQRGEESVASFRVPAHVPVERVSFVLGGGGPANFSRKVLIRARAEGDAGAMSELVEGQISRVKMTEHGQQLNLESLSVPSTVGSNAQADADVEVAVDNGDDKPVAIRAVRLEMRERRLCFDAAAGAMEMYYGDARLSAPMYDYSRLFNPAAAVRVAQLGPETANPLYQPVVVVKPFAERHPGLIWVALVGVIGVLGAVAWQAGRRV